MSSKINKNFKHNFFFFFNEIKQYIPESTTIQWINVSVKSFTFQQLKIFPQFNSYFTLLGYF